MELAPLVVQRDATRSLTLVALAQVQEVRARLGAHVGVQLERNALRLLVPNLPGEGEGKGGAYDHPSVQ